MISPLQSQVKKVTFLIVFLLIFSVIYVGSQEDIACELALGKCMLDALKQFPNVISFTQYTTYCLTGYLFCKKYLDKKYAG
jgi:hypothetical protein